MNIGDLTGHLAFGLIALSFLVKDILWLRIVSIVASLFSVFYNWVIPAEPMWIPIGWNFVFVLLNLYHIAIIARIVLRINETVKCAIKNVTKSGY